MLNQEKLAQLVQKMVDNKKIYSAVLRVENSDSTFSWSGAAGQMQVDSRFFIASVTKLYITAIVLRLIEQNKLNLKDKIALYLPHSYCHKLHVLKGVDYSEDITVLHLISNTSGIPDYFFHKQANRITAADELLAGKDEPWPLDRTIELVKVLKPNFKPGANGKVAYSDTNYQLLGKIIETITQQEIGQVFQDHIFTPLALKNTYTYRDTSDNSPMPFYYKAQKIWLPKYMSSIAPEGGIVSTAEELMIFLKAFFNGVLFDKNKIEGLKKWNLLLPPPGMFYFGVGLEKLWIPWIASPFKPVKEVIGFWGQTGSFAFYNPQTELFFTGTTNQIDGSGHRAAANAIFKIIKSAL
jgi:D-alanyl-D-alanine carboxypeptidase